jgi:hypothetical protein
MLPMHCTCRMQVGLIYYQHPFATPKNIGNVSACPCTTTDFMQQDPSIQPPDNSANMQKRSRVNISEHCNTRAETYLKISLEAYLKTFISAQNTPLPFGEMSSPLPLEKRARDPALTWGSNRPQISYTCKSIAPIDYVLQTACNSGCSFTSPVFTPMVSSNSLLKKPDIG